VESNFSWVASNFLVCSNMYSVIRELAHQASENIHLLPEKSNHRYLVPYKCSWKSISIFRSYLWKIFKKLL